MVRQIMCRNVSQVLQPNTSETDKEKEAGENTEIRFSYLIFLQTQTQVWAI